MSTPPDSNEPKLTPPPAKVMLIAIVVTIGVMAGGAWLLGLLSPR